ncbi:hypothetical protein [Pseudoalteromonas luteoviolacea]|uniref:Uncharacterized protein n=1 Tax=Pseudoalteromonas luteoviolacea NCIMB 1942 TaxID=1365253 RepID=A0A167HBP1_9GAMM|nr:hypothetical protein [Pseudoalteromonas luteoviolacea]KZN57946.1 hypothetical protein N482_23040 [Pseudoalteromonas luteoviolacea NCIMB 1942]
MPRMNGFEFLESFSELRNGNPNYSSLVFTMFTSSEIEEDKQKNVLIPLFKDFSIGGI